MRRRLCNRPGSADEALAAACRTPRRRLTTILPILGAVAVAGCTSPRGDDRQTHADGGAAASTTRVAPSADPLPRTRLSLRDRASWRPVLKWPDECEEAFRASHVGEDAGLVFNELGPGLSFVETQCAAGSYQPSFVYVRFDERPRAPVATVVSFRVYQSPDGRSIEQTNETELWGEPSLSPLRQELTVLNLARQTGDCGIWTRYNIGSDTPAVVDVRTRLPCPPRPGPRATSESGDPPRGWRPVQMPK
jgi:hypothetical protein